MEYGPEENESSSCHDFAPLVGASLEARGFGCDCEVAAVGWHGRGGLRVSRAESQDVIILDRVIEDKDFHGRRFRKEERYRPTMASPYLTSFTARYDLATLATRDPSAFAIVRFATPEGAVEFSRMLTTVESRYYHKLSPENFVHYKSEQTLKLRKELGEFEQRYKAWIVWTIVTPEDPVGRARVIEFWFEVAKVREIHLFVSFV